MSARSKVRKVAFTGSYEGQKWSKSSMRLKAPWDPGKRQGKV